MASDKKIGLVLALDGEKEFRNAVTSINKSIAATKSELKLVSAQFEGNANSLEALQKKHEVYGKLLDEQNRKYGKTEEALKAAEKKYRSLGKTVGGLEDIFQQQKNKLNDLKQSYEEARQRLKRMTDEGNSSEKSMQKQRGTIKALKNAINEQKEAINNANEKLSSAQNEYRKCGNIVSDWETKLNTAKAQIISAQKELNKYATYMEEAEKATDHCATSIDKFGNRVDNTVRMEWAEHLKSGFAEAAASKGLDILAETIDAVKDSMYDISKASSSFAAQTGLTGSALEKYKDVMLEIRGNNFGEDYSDVSSVMAEIVQIMGELDPSNMQATTESAIALRDTFGMDVNEQIRAVDVMMKTLGVDATQAFNLITTGAQRGLNRSGELVDNITEYGQLWGQAGFSAEEMFAIMENGLDAGAYNLDKVNDYVKEFGNSLADGRIEKNLGSFSDNTQKLFEAWQNGEATTSDVFYSVIDDLSEMTNQQEALTLASEVWSALGEDNAMQVITALNDVNTAYSDVKGAADSLKEVSYSDLESTVSGFGAAVQENILTPIGETVLPLIQGAVETATEVIEGIGGSIDPQQEKINTLVASVTEANEELKTTLDAADTAVGDAETEAGRIQVLGEQLINLNGVEEKSLSQRYQLKAIVEELGTTIPEIAAAYDEEAGKVNLSDAATRDLIGSTKELIIAQAAQNAMQEVANELIEARIALSEAETAKDVASDKAAMYQEEAELLQELKAGYEEYELAMSNATSSGANADELKEIESSMTSAAEVERRYLEFWDEQLKSGRATIEEYNAALENVGILELSNRIEENKNSCDEWNKTLIEASGSTDELKANVEVAEDKVNTYNTAAQESVEALTQAGEAAGETGSAYSEMKDGLDTSTGALEENADAAKAAAEAQKNAADAILEAYHGYVDEIKTDLQNKVSLFDKFDGGEDLTTEQINENLKSQAEGIKAYQENLEKVRAMTDENGKAIFSPELMAEIEAGGLDFANVLSHIVYTWENEGEYGAEQVKSIAVQWLENLNMTEGMAEVGAANKLAYEAAMGEFGSTEADFSGLEKSIEDAKENAGEGWSGLSDATKAALDETVQTAKTMGIQIPEGLTEGIASGEVSAEEALSQLNGSIQGRFEGLAEVAKEAGIAGVDELAAGIASGETTVEEAYQTLIASLAAQTADLETTGAETGSNAGDSIVTGLEEKTEAVSGAMDAVAQAGADAATNKATAYYEAGALAASEYVRALEEARAKASSEGTALVTVVRTAAASEANKGFGAVGYFMATGMAQGLIQGAGVVQSAARSVVASAKAAAQSEADEHSPSRVWRKEIGLNLSKGAALGILDGQKDVMAASRNMAQSALLAAQEELDIHSPSKKFRQKVGQNISESTAFGIRDKASLAGKAAKRMSNKVYTNAVSWLAKYKKKQQVSLDDEEYYWKQVLKHVKKGTTAYNNAAKKLGETIFDGTGLSGSSVTEAAKKIADNFGVSKYTKSGKKKTKKSDDTYYSEIYSAAEKYLSNMQVLNDWYLEQELAYWNGVKEQLKSGTQAWYDATKQINSLQADIAEAEAKAAEEAAKAAEEKIKTHADVQDDILDKYKVYYKVSAKAEADYWNIARKQFKAGTDERIEADQKYYDALQEWYDERRELDEEYAENSKDINDELIENIQELQDAYHDAVQSRKQDILSSMNLFESWDASGYDADTLLYNLKTQVAGLALWEQQLEELGKKGLTDGLMEELRQMGPDAAANIYSLNQMTAEQLAEYNKLWEQKGALAESQAVKDNADLLKETNSEILQLRKDAQSELDLLNAEYKAALQELNTGISGDLKNLVNKAGTIGEDAVSSLIAGIGKAATAVDTYSSTTKVVNTISGQLGTLSDAGKTIGENTLQSILDQLTDAEKINTAAKSAAQSIASAMQEELLLRQDAMNELNSIGNGGVVMLNNLAKSAYNSQQTIVNVDNNGILSVLQQMFNGMQIMTEEIKNLQMVIYPDIVAGQMQTAMDKANADAAILKNRGRY